MNKYFFYILILGLALGITLGAVYYLNLGNMTQNMNEISNQKTTPEIKVIQNEVPSEPIAPEVINSSIIVDENTPKNYKNEDLINLEKELNSLDLSSENDIE
jgi:hypothetical protein